jgi:hypothetical protein
MRIYCPRACISGSKFSEGLHYANMGHKIQFSNRFTDLSLEINHLRRDSHISFNKNRFVRIKSETSRSLWIWTQSSERLLRGIINMPINMEVFTNREGLRSWHFPPKSILIRHIYSCKWRFLYLTSILRICNKMILSCRVWQATLKIVLRRLQLQNKGILFLAVYVLSLVWWLHCKKG